MSEPKKIRSKAEFEVAMRELASLFDAKPEPGSPEFKRLKELVRLVEEYELARFPMLPPDPIEAAKFWAEQIGCKKEK